MGFMPHSKHLVIIGHIDTISLFSFSQNSLLLKIVFARKVLNGYVVEPLLRILWFLIYLNQHPKWMIRKSIKLKPIKIISMPIVRLIQWTRLTAMLSRRKLSIFICKWIIAYLVWSKITGGHLMIAEHWTFVNIFKWLRVQTHVLTWSPLSLMLNENLEPHSNLLEGCVCCKML